MEEENEGEAESQLAWWQHRSMYPNTRALPWDGFTLFTDCKICVFVSSAELSFSFQLVTREINSTELENYIIETRSSHFPTCKHRLDAAASGTNVGALLFQTEL